MWLHTVSFYFIQALEPNVHLEVREWWAMRMGEGLQVKRQILPPALGVFQE